MKKLLVSLALVIVASHANAGCVTEREQPKPVYVMGTLVQPQSDVLIVGSCDKTYDELDQAYVAAPKAAFEDEKPATSVLVFGIVTTEKPANRVIRRHKRTLGQ